MTILVEAAVESLDDAMAAVEGGAHRLELCADLDAGGTTPDRTLLEQVLSRVTIPVVVMIRPRAGDFVYSRAEHDRMLADAESMLSLGAAGVVLGVLDSARRVSLERTRELVTAARGAPVTFHRAIDETPDLLAAIDAAASAGVARILTSGGAATAREGAETIRSIVRRAGARPIVVAGGSIRASNVVDVVRRSGVAEVHARCGGDARRIAAIAEALAHLG